MTSPAKVSATRSRQGGGATPRFGQAGTDRMLFASQRRAAEQRARLGAQQRVLALLQRLPPR